eukprot:gnl/MRDRNA2_/MRDRNA2_128699_c0_seq1.p1 gnl/MRDRNA2_/MRDRNA2_128699_c0~~gnl/MRDRNA2_/MRDRNA2_128699_c0_seq1.p1  ORF type:complete len:566 (+),score=104.37 gnl/MRDRNA2_/MRDRNA2_128699_c0_seq1:40-1737(+)
MQMTVAGATMNGVAECLFDHAALNSCDDLVILHQLGRGSFAVVDRVIRKTSGEAFALKSISKTKLAEQKELQSRLRRELIAQKKFGHPNIIRMLRNFDDQEFFYLLMEYADGGQLSSHLDRCRQLAEVEATGIFVDVARALSHLHEHGMIHGNVQPKAILLVGRMAKLADFGRGIEQPVDVTFSGGMNHVAPEVIAGKPYDHKIDVWAVGTLLYEMVVGCPPLSVTPECHNSEFMVPAEVSLEAKLLMSVLAQVRPEDRPELKRVLARKSLQQDANDARQEEECAHHKESTRLALQEGCSYSPKRPVLQIPRLPLKQLNCELSQEINSCFEQDADALQVECGVWQCHADRDVSLNCLVATEDLQIDTEALEEACRLWKQPCAQELEGEAGCLLGSGALHQDTGLLGHWNQQHRAAKMSSNDADLRESCSGMSITGSLLGEDTLQEELGLCFVGDAEPRIVRTKHNSLSPNKRSHMLFSSLEPIVDLCRSDWCGAMEADPSPGAQSTALPSGPSTLSCSSKESSDWELFTPTSLEPVDKPSFHLGSMLSLIDHDRGRESAMQAPHY